MWGQEEAGGPGGAGTGFVASCREEGVGWEHRGLSPLRPVPGEVLEELIFSFL